MEVPYASIYISICPIRSYPLLGLGLRRGCVGLEGRMLIWDLYAGGGDLVVVRAVRELLSIV